MPQSEFYHLGTSTELYALLMSPVTCDSEKLTYFRDHYALESVCNSVCEESASSVNIVYNSIIDKGGTVGTHCFVENSVISGSYTIGNGCIVSHISERCGTNLNLPNDVMIQELNVETGYVVIALGRQDNMKAAYNGIIFSLDCILLYADTDFRLCGVEIRQLMQVL